MATTWIVAADASRARFLQVADRERLVEIEDLVNPEGRRIGNYLEKARTDHRYDKLYLVAPPKFLGLIRKELGKEVEKLVSDDLSKDLSWFNAREIERYFAKDSARAP
jgi:hypothetical protein